MALRSGEDRIVDSVNVLSLGVQRMRLYSKPIRRKQTVSRRFMGYVCTAACCSHDNLLIAAELAR